MQKTHTIGMLSAPRMAESEKRTIIWLRMELRPTCLYWSPLKWLTAGERPLKGRVFNIFFACGTEDELKTFVYDNVNLPYLRFYYRHTHVGYKIVKVPLVVPDNQIHSLKIICAADSDDIVVSPEEVEKFKSGQKVRITGGKFAGVTGIVARYQSQLRVGIIIEGLLTVCTAYVPSAFLQKFE